MDTIRINSIATPIPAKVADVTTPVSLYLKLRDTYPNTILLESSDYHGNSNSLSFICFKPLYEFIADGGQVLQGEAHKELQPVAICDKNNVPALLDAFIKRFEVVHSDCPIKVNGLFGYSTFDAVQYFDTLTFDARKKGKHSIPELRYTFYKYIVAFNHFTNQMFLIENLHEGEEAGSKAFIQKLYKRSIPDFRFKASGAELSNLTDEQYKAMVSKGKEHCFRGDVFQVVLSRQYRQQFEGDEFNVYRALRNINPSPYLFYFDYGSYKIFGSSPEAQLVIDRQTATINPIAGTFKRTGDDAKDQALALQLSKDEKENAEHVMLVDLARNDLSRNCDRVEVNTYKEVQFYSHVIHLVSKVSGRLKEGATAARVMADTFPAGTLSGAPKYKAMQLIDSIENQNRGYYGGCIGNIGFDGSFNQAIMIRSFLSKHNTLFYQAGAGVVSESKEENELQEVNNKLGALKKAIQLAEEF
ncbi:MULTISPECIES: anthranilate synthase component I family protein [unclassified Carboxylicivirga]|uniref:anthranilate synthase component I family protein n=1 Tax=Carboxylicivirga TaxID=1628153 RepID=UPI003D34339B